jgi:hypothetical protein
MDSVFDRAGEAIVYVGIVIGASRAGMGAPWTSGYTCSSFRRSPP